MFMSKHERLTLIAAILGSGIVALDSTVVNIALPAIAGGLHSDYSGLQWVIDGYLLTLSALILIGGSLGDIFGQKRVFEWGVIGFAAASVACGLAPTIGLLTAGRLLQGIFGALLVPSSLAIINTTFAPERRSSAIGTWTAYGGIFVAIGPLIGGLLIGLSWRWIFLINLPLALICLYVIRQAVTDPKLMGNRPSVDVIGGMLAVSGLGATTYGLIEGPAHGWLPLALPALILGLIALMVFIPFERKHPAPMLPLSLFRSRNFSGANLTTFGMYAALGGGIFSIVLYLQTAVGYSPIAAGLAFLPVTIMMFLFAGRAGALSGHYGPRLFMTFGPIISSVGFLLMLRISPSSGNYFTQVLPAALIFGTGLVLTVAPLTATVMASAAVEHSGIASAVNNAVARVAGLLIVALLGVVVATQTTHSLNSSPINLSTESVRVIHQGIAAGLKRSELTIVPEPQRSAVTAAVNSAQRGTFVYAILLNSALAFAAGLVAFVTIRNPRKLP
jgi:EmrB/QacA subfamily drug resistance transporter